MQRQIMRELGKARVKDFLVLQLWQVLIYQQEIRQLFEPCPIYGVLMRYNQKGLFQNLYDSVPSIF